MNTGANVLRIVQRVGGRAAAWVVESMSRSGEGKAVIWPSFAEEHQPRSSARMSRRDLSDLQTINANPQFGPADM